MQKDLLAYLQQVGIDPATAQTIVTGKGSLPPSPYAPLRNYQEDEAFGITTLSPYSYDPFEGDMANRQQTEVSPTNDWQDDRAQRQSGLERWGNAGLRFATKTAIYGASGVLDMAWAPIEAIAKGDINALYDNTLSNFSDELIEELDKHNPIYRTKAYEQQNLFKQIFGGSGVFLPEMIDTLAFVAGAMTTEALSLGLTTALTGGAGTLPAAVKAAGTINKFTNRFRKLSRAAEIANVADDVTRVREMASGINHALGVSRRIASGTGFEASIEALETYHNSRNNLYEAFRLQNGRDPDAEEAQNLDSKAHMAGAFTYAANVAALTISNAIQMPRTFGLAKVSPSASLGERIMKDATTGLLTVKPIKNKALHVAKIIGTNSLTEGAEEGIQSIISDFSSDFAFNLAIEENQKSISDLIMGTLGDKIKDKDFWHEVVAGALIGALGMPNIGGMAENISNKYKSKKEDEKAAANPNYKKKEFGSDIPWWSGGILGDVLDDKAKTKQAKQAADEINTLTKGSPDKGLRPLKDILSEYAKDKLAALAYSAGLTEDAAMAKTEEELKVLEEKDLFIQAYTRLKYGLKDNFIGEYESILDEMVQSQVEGESITTEQKDKLLTDYKSKIDSIEESLLNVLTLSPNLDQMTKIKMAQELYVSKQLGSQKSELMNNLIDKLYRIEGVSEPGKSMSYEDVDAIKKFTDLSIDEETITASIKAMEEAISEFESRALGKKTKSDDVLDSYIIDPEDVKKLESMKAKLEKLKAQKEEIVKAKQEIKLSQGRTLKDILDNSTPEIKSSLQDVMKKLRSVGTLLNKSKKIFDFLTSNDKAYKDAIANFLRNLWAQEGSSIDNTLFNANVKKAVASVDKELQKEQEKAKEVLKEETNEDVKQIHSEVDNVITSVREEIKNLVNTHTEEWRDLKQEPGDNHDKLRELKEVIDKKIVDIVKRLSELRQRVHENAITKIDAEARVLHISTIDRMISHLLSIEEGVFNDVSFFYNSESVLKLFFPKEDGKVDSNIGIELEGIRADASKTEIQGSFPAPLSRSFPPASRVRKYFEQYSVTFYKGDQLLGVLLELESIVFDGDPTKNLKTIIVDNYGAWTQEQLKLIKNLNSRFVTLYKTTKGELIYNLTEEGIRFVENIMFINELRNDVINNGVISPEELAEKIEFRTQFLWGDKIDTKTAVPYDKIDNAVSVDGNRYPVIFDSSPTLGEFVTAGRLFTLVIDRNGNEKWYPASNYVIKQMFGSLKAYEEFALNHIGGKVLNTRYIGFAVNNSNTGGQVQYTPLSLNYRKQYDPETGIIESLKDRELAEGFFKVLRLLERSNDADEVIDMKDIKPYTSIYNGILNVVGNVPSFKFAELTSNQKGHILGLLNQHVFIASDRSEPYSYNFELTLPNMTDKKTGKIKDPNNKSKGNIILSVTVTIPRPDGTVFSENFINLPNFISTVFGQGDVNKSVSELIRTANQELNRVIKSGPNAGALLKELGSGNAGMQYGDNIHNIYFTEPQFREKAAHPSNYSVALGGKQEIKVVRKNDNRDTSTFTQNTGVAEYKRFVKALAEDQSRVQQPIPGRNTYLIDGEEHERVTNYLGGTEEGEPNKNTSDNTAVLGTVLHDIYNHIMLQIPITDEKIDEWLQFFVDSPDLDNMSRLEGVIYDAIALRSRLQSDGYLIVNPRSLGLDVQEFTVSGTTHDGVKIAGKIDMILKKGKQYIVVDFKSGDETKTIIDGKITPKMFKSNAKYVPNLRVGKGQFIKNPSKIATHISQVNTYMKLVEQRYGVNVAYGMVIPIMADRRPNQKIPKIGSAETGGVILIPKIADRILTTVVDAKYDPREEATLAEKEEAFSNDSLRDALDKLFDASPVSTTPSGLATDTDGTQTRPNEDGTTPPLDPLNADGTNDPNQPPTGILPEDFNFGEEEFYERRANSILQTLPNETITRAEAIQNIRDLIPEDMISDQALETLFSNIEVNGFMAGVVANGMLYLANNTAVGTEYHEVFHIVYRHLMSEAEVNEIIEAAKLEYGEPSNDEIETLINTYPSFYAKFTKDQIKEIWLEERMAEDFKNFMLGQKKKGLRAAIKRLFRRLLTFFNIVKDPKIQALFIRIKDGDYRNAVNRKSNLLINNSTAFAILPYKSRKAKDAPITTTILDTKLAEQVISVIARNATKLKLDEEMDIRSAAFAAIEKFKTDNALSQWKKFIDDNIKDVNAKAEAERRLKTLQAILAAISNKDNERIIISEVLKLEKLYDYNFFDEEDEDSEVAPTITSDDGHEIGMEEGHHDSFNTNALNIGSEMSAQSKLRQWLRNIPLKIDILNMTELVNPLKRADLVDNPMFENYVNGPVVYNYLLRILSDQSSEEMLNTLKEVSKYDPEVKAVLEQLYIDITGQPYDPELDLRRYGLRSNLYQLFIKGFTNYTVKSVAVTIDTQSGKTKTFNSNSRDVDIEQVNEWAIAYKNNDLNYNERSEILNEVIKKLTLQDVNRDTDLFQHAIDVRTALDKYGIKLSPLYIKWSMLNRMLTINEHNGEVMFIQQSNIPLKDRYTPTVDDINFWKAFRFRAQDVLNVLTGSNNTFLLTYFEQQNYIGNNNDINSKPVGMFVSNFKVDDKTDNQSIFFQLRRLAYNNAKFDKSVFSYSFRGLDGKPRYDKIKPNLIIEVINNLKHEKGLEFLNLYKTNPQAAYESFSDVWGIYDPVIVKNTVDFFIHNPLLANPDFRKQWINSKLALDFIDGTLSTMIGDEPIDSPELKEVNSKKRDSLYLLNKYTELYSLASDLKDIVFPNGKINVELLELFRSKSMDAATFAEEIGFTDQDIEALGDQEFLEDFVDNVDERPKYDGYNIFYAVYDLYSQMAANETEINLDLYGVMDVESAKRYTFQIFDQFTQLISFGIDEYSWGYEQVLKQIKEEILNEKINDNDEDDFSTQRQLSDIQYNGTAWGKQDPRTKTLTMLYMFQQEDHILDGTNTRYYSPNVTTKNLEMVIRLPFSVMIDAKGKYTPTAKYLMYSLLYQEMDRINRTSKLTAEELEELNKVGNGPTRMNDLFELKLLVEEYDRVNGTNFYNKILTTARSSEFTKLISPIVYRSSDVVNSQTSDLIDIMEKLMDYKFKGLVDKLKSPDVEIIINTKENPNVDQSFLLPEAYRTKQSDKLKAVVNYNALKNDTLNMYLMSYFFNQTIRFDDALVSQSMVNILKRGAATIGSGPAVGMHGGIMRTAVIEDVMHNWAEDDFKIVKPNGQKDGPDNTGERSALTDGQTYTNVWNYMINYLYPLGKLTPKVMSIYTKLLKLEPLTKGEELTLKKNLALVNSRKMLFEDPVVLIKTSVDVISRAESSWIEEENKEEHSRMMDEIIELIKELVKNDNIPSKQIEIRGKITQIERTINERGFYKPIRGMEKVNNLLTVMENNGIDLLAHKSAVKKASPGEVNSPTILSTKYYREQVVTDAIKQEINDGIQKLQLVFSEQNPEQAVKIFNTNTSMANLIRGYIIALSQRARLGLTYKMNDLLNGEEINWEVLMETLRNNMEASNADGFIMQMFQLSEGKPKFNLNASMIAKKIEPMLLSILGKGTLRHKTSGGKFSLSSSAYIEVVVNEKDEVVPYHIVKNNPSKYENYKTRPLAHNKYDPSTGEYYSECLIPAFIAELYDLKEGETLNLPPKLLKFLGYRIPTQGKSSMSNLRVVGILPAWRGNVIFVPWQSVPLTGEDFDIDAKYLTGYSWYKKNGVVKFYGDYVLAPTLAEAKKLAYEEFINYIEENSYKFKQLHRAKARELEFEIGSLRNSLSKYTKYLRTVYEDLVNKTNKTIKDKKNVKSLRKQLDKYFEVLNYISLHSEGVLDAKKPDIDQSIINAIRIKMEEIEKEGIPGLELNGIFLRKEIVKLRDLKTELTNIRSQIKAEMGLPQNAQQAEGMVLKDTYGINPGNLTFGQIVERNYRMANFSNSPWDPSAYQYLTPEEASNFMLDAQFKFVINESNVNASQALTSLESPNNMVRYMVNLKYSRLPQSERERIRQSRNYSNLQTTAYLTDIIKAHEIVYTGMSNISIFALGNIANEYLAYNNAFKDFTYTRSSGSVFGTFNSRNEQISNNHNYRINYLLSSYLTSATDNIKEQHSYILNLYSVIAPAVNLMILDGWNDIDIMLFINNPLVDIYIKKIIRSTSNVQNYFETTVKSRYKITREYQAMINKMKADEVYIEESFITNEQLEEAIINYNSMDIPSSLVETDLVNITALDVVLDYMKASEQVLKFNNILSLIKGPKPTLEENYEKFEKSLQDLKIIIDPYTGRAYWANLNNKMPKSIKVDFVTVINNHENITSQLYVYLAFKREFLSKVLYAAKPEFEYFMDILKDNAAWRTSFTDIRKAVQSYVTYAQNMYFRKVTSVGNELFANITFEEMRKNLFTTEFTETVKALASSPRYANNYLLRSLATTKHGVELLYNIVTVNKRKEGVKNRRLQRPRKPSIDSPKIYPVTLDTTKVQKPSEVAKLNTAIAELYAEYLIIDSMLKNLNQEKEYQRGQYEMTRDLLYKLLRGIVIHALSKDAMMFTNGTLVRAIWPELLVPLFKGTDLVGENNGTNALRSGKDPVLNFNYNTIYEFLKYYIRDERNRFLPREIKTLPDSKYRKSYSVTEPGTNQTNSIMFFSGLDNGQVTEQVIAAFENTGFAFPVYDNKNSVIGYKFPLFFRSGRDIYFLTGIRNDLSELGMVNFPAESNKVVGFEAEYRKVDLLPSKTNGINLYGFTEEEVDHLFGKVHRSPVNSSIIMENLYKMRNQVGESKVKGGLTFNVEIVDNYFPQLVVTGIMPIDNKGNTEYGSMIILNKSFDQIDSFTQEDIDGIKRDYWLDIVTNAGKRIPNIQHSGLDVRPTSNMSLSSNIITLMSSANLTIGVQIRPFENEIDKAAAMLETNYIKLSINSDLNEIDFNQTQPKSIYIATQWESQDYQVDMSAYYLKIASKLPKTATIILMGATVSDIVIANFLKQNGFRVVIRPTADYRAYLSKSQIVPYNNIEDFMDRFNNIQVFNMDASSDALNDVTIITDGAHFDNSVSQFASEVGSAYGATNYIFKPESLRQQYSGNYKVANPRSQAELAEAEAKYNGTLLKLNRTKIDKESVFAYEMIIGKWFLIKNADSVFIIDSFIDGISRARSLSSYSMYGAQMTINESNKALYVFDQDNNMWYMYDRQANKFTEISEIPVLDNKSAIFGAKEINDIGKRAVERLFKKTKARKEGVIDVESTVSTSVSLKYSDDKITEIVSKWADIDHRFVKYPIQGGGHYFFNGETLAFTYNNGPNTLVYIEHKGIKSLLTIGGKYDYISEEDANNPNNHIIPLLINKIKTGNAKDLVELPNLESFDNDLDKNNC